MTSSTTPSLLTSLSLLSSSAELLPKRRIKASSQDERERNPTIHFKQVSDVLCFFFSCLVKCYDCTVVQIEFPTLQLWELHITPLPFRWLLLYLTSPSPQCIHLPHLSLLYLSIPHHLLYFSIPIISHSSPHLSISVSRHPPTLPPLHPPPLS